ncbi:hypothetical protein FR932_03930 [Moritella marina ATCC 15381]|uniref:Uncharacterized protein n=1 Tax=Moritella marina ATCC 15381 TaxID=1202962 RepID=A0A5J6WGA6_MORMI|nr:hypothetical protein [Moritella marina]QFI37037.1 hypothetical protein FR932_03930 [Moritella marina ATCC 15381]
MIQLKENIKNNFVYFRSQGIHIGGGFIIPFNNEYYCITAGHVIFGRDFSKEREFNIFCTKNNHLDSYELLSCIEFARKYDLTILKIKTNIDHVCDVVICDSIINSKLMSLSYVKAENLNEPVFLELISFSDKLEENKVRYNVKTHSFNNFTEDLHGPDAMEGISGSPLLLCNSDGSIVFHGVINKIPNNGVGDLVDSRALYPIKEIIEDIEVVSRDSFDSSHKLIKYNSGLLSEDKFNRWIEDWKNKPENKNFYSNLEEKLENIYGDSFYEELPKELQKIMIGDKCFKDVIERNSALFECYQDVVETAERDSMLEYVNSNREALQHYKKVYENHLEIINEDLAHFGLSRTDKRKIAQYNIATWMAVCHLRFRKV